MQSKVTMIIPCYNKVNYIGGTFDSVLAQKWDNIELILVNDGCTDGTRDIIAEYEPKFIARGYELIIIDQENQGCSAAVKAGLLRMTGKYVCMPDCDDRLDKEFVSKMATWLEDRPEFNVVVCDSDVSTYDLESAPGLKRKYMYDYDCYPYRLIESALTSRIHIAACLCLYRSGFLLKDCNILSMDTRFRYSQEAQMTFRVVKYASKIGLMHEKLYYWNKNEDRYNTMGGINKKTWDNMKSYILTQMQEVLNLLIKCNFDISIIDTYKAVVPLRICSAQNHPEAHAYAIEQIPVIKKNISASGIWDADMVNDLKITPENVVIFYRALSNALIGYNANIKHISRKSKGRIIAYAALSRAAKGILPHIINSNLRPEALWDARAEKYTSFQGIEVTKPDFEHLTEKDTVLVFIKTAKVAKEVSDLLESTPARGNIYYYYDVLDYLTQVNFPEISTINV